MNQNNKQTNSPEISAKTGRPKQRRGFAAMSPEKLHEIASSGGRACHAKGKGRTWTVAKASEAGRRGGLTMQANLRRKKLEGVES